MNVRFFASRNIAILIFLLSPMLAPIAHADENSPCNVEQTKKDMNIMIDRDVHERLVFIGSLKEAEAKKGGKLTYKEALPLAEGMQKGDKLNQEELDRIVIACGWPKKDVFGKEPVRIAAMIMVHAPPEFTHRHMEQMMASYKAGETFPLWMATVIDEDLIAQGKPQRFGTRGDDLNADGSPANIEDPEHLQERRRAFGIPPVINVAEE